MRRLQRGQKKEVGLKLKRQKRIRDGVYRREWPGGRVTYRADHTRRDRKSGKRISSSKTFARLEDAVQWKSDQQKRGRVVSPALRVGAFLDEWAAGLENSDRQPNTIASYRRGIERVRSTSLWDLKFRDLDTEAVRAAYEEIQLKTPRAVRYAHDALSVAFGELVANGKLQSNPATHAQRKEHRTAEANPWTSDEEIHSFLDVADRDRFAGLWRLLVLGGLRIGEALGVREEDVDIERRGVWVRGQFTRENGKPVYKKLLKTKRSGRFVSLDSTTISALEATRKGNRRERLAAGAGWVEDPHMRLFRHGLRAGRGGVRAKPGTPLAPGRAINERLLKLTREARVRHIPPHQLRHTSATWLLRNGFDLYSLSCRLGHSSTAETERTYAKWLPGDDRRAAELWESKLGSPGAVAQ